MDLGSRKSSKTKYSSSYLRQNSSNELGMKQKERGSSAQTRTHTRPHSAKDPGLRSNDNNHKAFVSS